MLNLGASSFDVSIMMIEEGIFEIISTQPVQEYEASGEKIDEILVSYCLLQFHQATGINFSNDKRALQELKRSCERAKIRLSSAHEAKI